jgi:AhpD family alkylhydroperoxidase
LYKTAVLKTSTLTPKYVELISIAVSSALRCNHCTDYHVQAAIRKGASKDEILEAILIAGLTSQSTVLADAYRTYADSIEECTSCAIKVPVKDDATEKETKD